MKEIIVRAVKLYNSRHSTLLHLLRINEDGHETLIARSSPIPKIAAIRVCRLLEQPFTVAPSVDSLKKVLRIPGNTIWASATAADAQTAALKACLQHDIKTAQGMLTIVTLSPDSSIVSSMRSAIDVIYRKTPAITVTALVIAHDETLRGQVRVELLLTGVSNIPYERSMYETSLIFKAS
jgi:hypothetical protein